MWMPCRERRLAGGAGRCASKDDRGQISSLENFLTPVLEKLGAKHFVRVGLRPQNRVEPREGIIIPSLGFEHPLREPRHHFGHRPLSLDVAPAEHHGRELEKDVLIPLGARRAGPGGKISAAIILQTAPAKAPRC